MQALIAWLGSFFSLILRSSVLQFVAFKVVLRFLFVTILPVVLYNLGLTLVKEVTQAVADGAGSISGPDLALSFTGLTAYLMTEFGIVSGLSIVLSALAYRVAIRMIPFLGR